MEGATERELRATIQRLSLGAISKPFTIEEIQAGLARPGGAAR